MRRPITELQGTSHLMVVWRTASHQRGLESHIKGGHGGGWGWAWRRQERVLETQGNLGIKEELRSWKGSSNEESSGREVHRYPLLSGALANSTSLNLSVIL